MVKNLNRFLGVLKDINNIFIDKFCFIKSVIYNTTFNILDYIIWDDVLSKENLTETSYKHRQFFLGNFPSRNNYNNSVKNLHKLKKLKDVGVSCV